MECVTQQHLRAHVAQIPRGHGFHGAVGADGLKNRRLHFTVRERQFAAPRRAILGQYFKHEYAR